MVLFNASSRSRNVGSTTHRPQGGGDKKAGFPYQIGREAWSSVFLNTCNPAKSAPCCNLTSYQNTSLIFTKNITRPQWVRPGSAYGFQSPR